MAEILGVVSGAIAVGGAAQAAASRILAFKRLWNEVHRVPDRVNFLLDRLGLVEALLLDMEAELNQAQNILNVDSPMQMSFRHCRAALSNLVGLMDDLRQKIEDEKRLKRNKARLKVVLGREMIQRLEKDMADALQLLSVAQQIYFM